MSKYLLLAEQNKKSKIWRTSNHEPIFMNTDSNLYQEVQNDTPFVPQNQVKPGQTSRCEIKNLSTELREEIKSYIRFKVDTSDGTNFPTAMRDAQSYIEFIEFEINRGADKINWNGQDAIDRLFSDWIFEHCGKRKTDPALFLADYRYEVSTYSGVQTTDTVNPYFYLPLAPFVPFLLGTVSNGVINDLRINIRFNSVPSSVAEACKFVKSNTTSAAYTSAIEFDDISYMRSYRIVSDVRTTLQAPRDMVMVPVPQFDRIVYDLAQWNTSADRVSFKLSDISKRPLTQRVHAFVRKKETAYNATDAGKKYSGYNYICFKLRQTFGERRTLDFTSATADNVRRLKAYELMQHRARYATDLPIETLNNATDLNKFYTQHTRIDFDTVTIEEGHNEVINGLNTERDLVDYVLDFECCGSVSTAPVELIVMVENYDQYLWNNQNQLVKQKL